MPPSLPDRCPEISAARASQSSTTTLGCVSGSERMIALLPSIHGFGALTVSITTRGTSLTWLSTASYWSRVTVPFVPSWMTTPCVKRYFVLASWSCCSSQSGPLDTSATVVMPRASSTGLAPSITDSPTAKYGLSCSTVVGGAVDDVGGTVWPGAAVGAGATNTADPDCDCDTVIVVGRSEGSVVVKSIARPACLSHSIWPTHWLLAIAMLTPANPTSAALAMPTAVIRWRRLYAIAVRGRRWPCSHSPSRPCLMGVSMYR